MRATEFIVETAMMGKIADSGKIIRILKKAHTVPFSDEKNWLLVDTDPGKGNSGLGIKWIPADTRFEWVRPFKDTVDENLSPQTIHKLADRKGVKWDNEPSFLQLTKRLTGKEHLYERQSPHYQSAVYLVVTLDHMLLSVTLDFPIHQYISEH